MSPIPVLIVLVAVLVAGCCVVGLLMADRPPTALEITAMWAALSASVGLFLWLSWALSLLFRRVGA